MASAPRQLISVGTRGDWQVQAAGVAPIHMYLAFDGSRLSVMATPEGSNVRVRNAPVGSSWQLVAAPSELQFGSACIIVLPYAGRVATSSGNDAAKSRVNSQVCIPAALRNHDARLMEDDSSVLGDEAETQFWTREAAEPEALGEVDRLTMVPRAKGLQGSDDVSRQGPQVLPGEVTFHLPNAALPHWEPGAQQQWMPGYHSAPTNRPKRDAHVATEATPVDGQGRRDGPVGQSHGTQASLGALAVIDIAPPARPLEPVDSPTCYDGGNLRHIAAKVALTLGTVPQKPEVVAHPFRVVDNSSRPKETAQQALRGRVSAIWLKASPVQRAIAALLAFALCGALWSPDSHANIQHVRNVESGSSLKLSGSTVNAIVRSDSPERSMSTSVPSAHMEAGSRSVPTPTGSAEEVDAEPRGVSRAPLAVPFSNGSAQPSTPGNAVAPSNALAAPPATNAAAERVAEQQLTASETSERDAFAAARTGNFLEAAERYQMLASGPRAGLFSRAADLVRARAVRTP